MKWFLVIIYVLANPSDNSKAMKIRAEIAMPSKSVCLNVKSMNHHITIECIGKRFNK